MRAAAFALAALVAAAPLALAETADGVSEALVALEKRSWEAWKNRDGKFFQDFLSDDHVEVGFGGPAKSGCLQFGAAGKMCRILAIDVR